MSEEFQAADVVRETVIAAWGGEGTGLRMLVVDDHDVAAVHFPARRYELEEWRITVSGLQASVRTEAEARAWLKFLALNSKPATNPALANPGTDPVAASMNRHPAGKKRGRRTPGGAK